MLSDKGHTWRVGRERPQRMTPNNITLTDPFENKYKISLFSRGNLRYNKLQLLSNRDIRYTLGESGTVLAERR